MPFCCKHTNFVAFAPAILKTCAERRAHACLLVTALKRFARLIARSIEQTVRSPVHAKNIRSFRMRFAGRSLTDTATSTLLNLSATSCGCQGSAFLEKTFKTQNPTIGDMLKPRPIYLRSNTNFKNTALTFL